MEFKFSVDYIAQITKLQVLVLKCLGMQIYNNFIC